MSLTMGEIEGVTEMSVITLPISDAVLSHHTILYRVGVAGGTYTKSGKFNGERGPVTVSVPTGSRFVVDVYIRVAPGYIYYHDTVTWDDMRSDIIRSSALEYGKWRRAKVAGLEVPPWLESIGTTKYRSRGGTVALPFMYRRMESTLSLEAAHITGMLHILLITRGVDDTRLHQRELAMVILDAFALYIILVSNYRDDEHIDTVGHLIPIESFRRDVIYTRSGDCEDFAFFIQAATTLFKRMELDSGSPLLRYQNAIRLYDVNSCLCTARKVVGLPKEGGYSDPGDFDYVHVCVAVIPKKGVGGCGWFVEGTTIVQNYPHIDIEHERIVDNMPKSGTFANFSHLPGGVECPRAMYGDIIEMIGYGDGYIVSSNGRYGATADDVMQGRFDRISTSEIIGDMEGEYREYVGRYEVPPLPLHIPHVDDNVKGGAVFFCQYGVEGDGRIYLSDKESIPFKLSYK